MADVLYNYKDLNPRPTGSSLNEGVEAIKGAIETVVSTVIGERIFNLEFGADIENILFEPIDDITTEELKDELQKVITTWDPRIQVSRYSKIEALPDENTYEVTLFLKILGYERGDEEENVYAFKFYLSKKEI